MVVLYLSKGWVDKAENVEMFLLQVKELLSDSRNLYIVQKTDVFDKTRQFRERYGINHEMVCSEICKLDISNYSYTDMDDNKKIGGVLFMFGQFILPPIVDAPLEVYIKLKIKKRVVCMSFHDAEFPLDYPYN